MYFPLKFIPKESYREAPRSFGARRDKGARKHAGCDLYAPVGTPVISVAAGTVVAVGEFYLSTWAVEVNHGTFIVRYGELKRQLGPGIKKGATVKPGTLIGVVGALEGLTISMLHFEMYTGAASGPLTDRANGPYMRRSDLLDPTPHLDQALLLSGRFDDPKMPLKIIGGSDFLMTA